MNSICTTKGGSHVNYITDQVVNHVMDWIKNSKKKEVKSAGVKNFHVKNHLWIFVNALIDNPAFDSQTKETLTTRQAQFGSTCQLTEKLLKSGGYRLSCVDLKGLPNFCRVKRVPGCEAKWVQRKPYSRFCRVCHLFP